MPEAVEPFLALAIEKIADVEITNLGRVVAAERRRIETRQAADRGPLSTQSIPHRVHCDADRRNGTDPRDGNSTTRLHPASTPVQKLCEVRRRSAARARPASVRDAMP